MVKVCEFQYDGKSSNDFDLKIINLERSSVGVADVVGLPLSIEEHRIKNKHKPLFFGTQVTGNLKFTLTIAQLPKDLHIINENILTPTQIGTISKWLFRKEYKELRILDDSYQNITFNCIFLNPRRVQVNGGTFGIEVDVVCDRPYGYRKYEMSRVVSGSATFNMKNLGLIDDFILPEIEVVTTGASFSINNNTDTGRGAFSFTSLTGGETIYVNNEREQIISSFGHNRNNNFNFNWFRVVPEYYNNITITGSGTFKFRFDFPMPT